MESRDIMNYEKEVCRKFDTGQFNDIAIAYLMIFFTKDIIVIFLFSTVSILFPLIFTFDVFVTR